MCSSQIIESCARTVIFNTEEVNMCKLRLNKFIVVYLSKN